MISFILFANRAIYGTLNIFNYPNRVYFNGYRYDRGISVILEDYEKPMYEISRNIDKFTGKRIYSKDKDFVGCGKVIYLRLNDNMYIAFASGGGG